jgi:hypothetical protein
MRLEPGTKTAIKLAIMYFGVLIFWSFILYIIEILLF